MEENMSEDTVIMETVKISIIQGSIEGISKEDFAELKDYTERYFHNVWWENDVMYINNNQGEPFLGTYDAVKEIFGQIAGKILEGKYGQLGFIGLIGKREIVSVIFFGHKQWELREFTRPETPEWYKTEDWYQRDKWREELEWKELFSRT
jgi:hypothetical protein